MTNIQFLLGIGFPGLLVILSWISNNSKLDRVDKRMDAFERRMDSFERRIDEVLASNHRDALEILRAMTALHERVAVVEANQK